MRPVCYLLISLVSLLTACTETPSESTTRAAVLTANRMTANRMTANRLQASRLSTSRLGASRLTSNRLRVNMASAGELLATSDGRELFSLIVSCALPDDITLVATLSGTEFEFFGEIGLARDWLHQPLDSDGKAAVSACLFARVNGRDVALPISVRGPDRTLATSEAELNLFSVEEGAFYGNFFTPLDQPILWIACRGAGQVAGDAGGLLDRDCAKPDPAHPGLTLCGFIFAGDCGDFAGEPACEQFSENGQFYRRCHAEPIDDEHHHGHRHHHHGAPHHDDDDHVFRQVITTYVRP